MCSAHSVPLQAPVSLEVVLAPHTVHWQLLLLLLSGPGLCSLTEWLRLVAGATGWDSHPGWVLTISPAPPSGANTAPALSTGIGWSGEAKLEERRWRLLPDITKLLAKEKEGQTVEGGDGRGREKGQEDSGVLAAFQQGVEMRQVKLGAAAELGRT